LQKDIYAASLYRPESKYGLTFDSPTINEWLEIHVGAQYQAGVGSTKW